MEKHVSLEYLRLMRLASDQGTFSNCVAFAVTACLSSTLALTTGEMYVFSPQQIVDLVGNEKNQRGYYGEIPKTNKEVLEYVVKNGVYLEKDYPYQGFRRFRVSKFKKKNQNKFPVLNIGGFTNVKEFILSQNLGMRQYHQHIDQLLRSGQTLIGAVQCTRALHVLPADKIYEGVTKDEVRKKVKSTGHSILIVGYGVTAKGVSYFRILNSWGKTWGTNGFGSIRRDLVHSIYYPFKLSFNKKGQKVFGVPVPPYSYDDVRVASENFLDGNPPAISYNSSWDAGVAQPKEPKASQLHLVREKKAMKKMWKRRVDYQRRKKMWKKVKS